MGALELAYSCLTHSGGDVGYKYQPKNVDDIIVRQFSFDFPDDIDPIWVPNNPIRSFLFNGISLTMPYLEPYLVKTMREAMEHVSEPALLEDMRGFNGQEAKHYQCHRRLNELIKKNGYPELSSVEGRLEQSYKKLSTRSLETRMAYSAGFECMTHGFTNWLIEKRQALFAGSDNHITSFWLMHMVEETEHKTVAFDAYMAVSGRFWPRFFGVFHGSFHVIGYGLVGMWAALREDNLLVKPATWLALARELGSMVWNVGPFMLRALLPDHNPRQEKDPQWMLDWVAGHAKLPADTPLPLVDTNDPLMAIPFK